MTLSDAQRAARATRCGASEISGLLGEHRYVQPHNIYDRIVEGVAWEAEPPSPAWVGQQLEATVLKMARVAFGLKARAISRPAIHPTLPMSASADGHAKDYLVEVKVTSAWGWEDKGAPSYIADQCIVQAALYGKPVVHLVVLSGSRFWTQPIEANAERFAVLEDAVAAFEANNLVPHIRPPQQDDFSNAPTRRKTK